MRRRVLLAVLLSVASSAALADVVARSGSPMVNFAAAEIGKVLKARGEDARIVVGTTVALKGTANVPKPPAVAEAFAIARAGNAIVVAGHDATGAMYGGLEVAEQIALGGVASVAAKASQPFLAVRQFKYNVPGLRDQEWFHSQDYWQSFFDLLAKARMNSVGFWHSHPFAYMIRYDKFPEAAVLTPEQTARNIKTWRMIFRLARERGVSTYLINWNIHLPAPFARKHGVKTEGEDSPVVRQYMRYCIGQTLRTYPDLTGIGACAGERMPSQDYDWREQWIKDTFLAGIADSGRKNVPLLHRYWWASCDSLKRIICADYDGPVYVPLKFNGEQMYTDTRPHFLDADWIDFPDYRTWLKRKRKSKKPQEAIRGVVSHLEWITKPQATSRKPQGPKPGTRNQEPASAATYPYKILWHLRNDTIHTYRWGDPDFVRGVVRNCNQPYAAGYLMGEERTQHGIDNELTDEAKRHQTWKYCHERHAFRFLLWGRLGYDPTIPDSRWIALFEQRFGKVVGKHLFTAMQQASKIIPLVSRYHFNYMNGDWAPEWCGGRWNTGFGRGRNYRNNRDNFHDIIEFVFNHTIDNRLLDIPEAATATEGGAASAAAELDAAAKGARTAAMAARAAGDLAGEAASMADEFEAQAELGDYYATKILAAAALMDYYVTGRPAARDLAVSRLVAAKAVWARLADKAGKVYRRASAYKRLMSRVQRDILLAATAGSAPEELKKLGVLKRAKDRPRYDFANEELRTLIETRLAPATQPLFVLDKVELSPRTCDILVLGKEAKGFDALPAAKKKGVLDAVEKGCALVIFFQNFPKFDTSWLPGGIKGKDSDADSFRWTDPKHRIALKLDPKDLDGHAIVNDALVGYDKSWTNLTDPPGGVCVRKHGKGMIIFCQLDVMHRYREPAARRLVHNIIRCAARLKPQKELRVVVLGAWGHNTTQILRKANVPHMWLDDMPLTQ